mmetsp:Transcript_26306/g.43403  ORF Transcript_26306/g.43403 Transcript_26306/m.43403 type:complete len:666 (-) Transcript_26306:134-2131(-)
MKLALASSLLLSVVCFPEEVAAFTASRPQIAAVRSSSYAQQSNVVALQAVAESTSNDESYSRQLNRRDALFRFAAATTTALISGSQIAVADDEVISAAAPAAAPDAVVEPASSATSNTLTVAKEDDFKSTPPAAAPKDVELKVAMEKSPASPVAKQPMDDSKLVAKMEEEVKAPVAAKKEVDIKVAALEKEVKEAPVIKAETKLFAKLTDDTDSASTLLLPTGKSAAIKASTPDSVATAVASVGAKTSATVLASLDAPGAAAKSIDKNVIGGAVAFAGLLTLAGIASNSEEDTTTLPTGTTAPGGVPYGLDGGRNFGEAPPKPPASASSPPAPAVVPDPALKESQKKWKATQPQPYGMINKDKNPFIKDMYEYCEGGKVTEKCTETITQYMEDIASTGAVASDEEVETITSYMDSLVPTSSRTGSTGTAIAGYLDALSVGTAPGPKNAKAVATYLDTLGGGSTGEIPKPFAKRFSPTAKAKPTQVAAKPAPVAAAAPVAAKPTPAASAAPVAAMPSPDFSKFDYRLKEIESQGSSTTSMIQQYDSRLNTIETRVTSLESKVDAIPDQVFQKMEAWQSKADLKLSEEVKKIISVLTPEAQEPPATPAPVAPVAPPPAPVPAPMPAPVVSDTVSSPAAASMPNSMLASNAAPGPKKSYGLGNASWKK